MAGINNGGGEYREYVWPIMLLVCRGHRDRAVEFPGHDRTPPDFGDLHLQLVHGGGAHVRHHHRARRLPALLAGWDSGETIIQGYYMHQGVGMWFMMYLLGLTYYFLPQQLNTPIFSYSLGILAFWTQILFYTVIGTHHFVFSSIPWSLQTVAIVGSMGMVIPVVAGTANFLLTFRGAFHKLSGSYTLPFFLVPESCSTSPDRCRARPKPSGGPISSGISPTSPSPIRISRCTASSRFFSGPASMPSCRA
jgi:cytochrome c oxidase cbb3-type subunit 1